jgi:hypothetical protein
MKKIFLSSVAAQAIGAIATLNMNIANQEQAMSGVSLANVEALASGESVGVVSCSGEGKAYCPLNGGNYAIVSYWDY